MCVCVCVCVCVLDVKPPKWYQEDQGADSRLVGQVNFGHKKPRWPRAAEATSALPWSPWGRRVGGYRLLLLCQDGKEPVLCHSVTGLIAFCPL